MQKFGMGRLIAVALLFVFAISLVAVTATPTQAYRPLYQTYCTDVEGTPIEGKTMMTDYWPTPEQIRAAFPDPLPGVSPNPVGMENEARTFDPSMPGFETVVDLNSP